MPAPFYNLGTFFPLGPLTVTTASLPNATVGTSYSQSISVSGGTGSGYSVYIQQAVPNSLRWIQMTGVTTLGGTPQMAETSQVTLVACDSGGNVSSPVTLSLTSTATGSLAFVSGTSLPTTTSGGILSVQQICSGGVPPYIHASSNQVQPWSINWDGFVLGAPTTTTAVSIIDTVTDSAGSSISQTLTVTPGSAIGLAGNDYNTSQINIPNGTTVQNYIYNFWAFGGLGGYSCSVTGGSLAPGLSISTLKITGIPTSPGTYFATVQVTDGTNSKSYSVCQQVLAADIATRPAYNTGSGFFVTNGKLYDSTGKHFQIRGVNRNHYDSSTWASNTNGALTGTNASRVFILDGQTGTQAATQCTGQYLPGSGNFVLPIITCNSFSGTNTTGNTTTTLLASVMNTWLAAYGGSGLNTVDTKVAYNIANEWGQTYANSTTAWLNAYQYQSSSITAISGSTVTVNAGGSTNPFVHSPFALIKGAGGITDVVLNVSSTGGISGAWTVTFTASPTGTYTSGGTLYGGAVGCMRGAGYLGPLVIDAGGSGQDFNGLIQNAQTVQNSDPQRNCIFAYHAYGSALNNECVIASVTTGSTTKLTLDSSLPYHPMAPAYTLFSSNNFTGNTSYVIAGALGMTGLNGTQNCSANNVGGSSGAWTVTLSLNSTGFPAYTANSARIVFPNDYRQIMPSLAALRANNVCVSILEFGPGNGTGSANIAFSGFISATTLTVNSMTTAGAILPNSIATEGLELLITGNATTGLTSNTSVTSQSSGTTGGTGNYVVTPSQTAGSVGSPITMYVQGSAGSNTNFGGPASGPSPTNTSLGQMISSCEANLLPWCYWALDDHNLGPSQGCAWIGWFGMESINTTFAVPSDLTVAGMDVTFNPCYGLRTLSQPASVFA